MLSRASASALGSYATSFWECEMSALINGFQERLAEVETYLEFLSTM